jgi:hypothetical protein
MMSQFMVNPSEDHINKSLHIVCYVNMNLNSKIGYDGKQEEGFIAYADADWASDHISRKSVTRYIIKLAGGAVSWVSRKQKQNICVLVIQQDKLFGLSHYSKN